VTLTSGPDDWFITHSGKQFWPLAPRVEDIDIEDIAWALSGIGRWGCHSQYIIPVAQHSVIVSRIVPHAQAFPALMHDSPEAYTGCDLMSPIKRHCETFQLIEHGLWLAIRQAYDIPELTPEIKHADRVSLMTEKRDHVADNPDVTWPFAESHPPLPGRIIPWEREFARQRFLERFHELTKDAYR
jgi:hypothetical protein